MEGRDKKDDVWGVSIRIPYIIGLAIRKDPDRFNLTTMRMERGRPYISWHLGTGRRQIGGWFPKVRKYA